MTPTPRLRTLEERHATLDRRIGEEGSRPQPNPDALTRLKLAKLRLKEQIEALRQRG